MGVQQLSKKFRKELNSHGFMAATKKTGGFLLNKVGLGTDSIIRRRKLQVSREINSLFQGAVAYGPFKGLQLGTDSWWCDIDRASMLFGLYEKEILECFDSLPQSHRTFINLGAADGYYAIGLLRSKKFDVCYAYEATQKGRECILSNAVTNGVAERLKVFGIAEKGFLGTLRDDGVDLARSVVLSDIEGGEFDLFDEEALAAFKGSVILVEIHDLYFDDGAEKLNLLKQNASKYFHVTEFNTGGRDPSPFPELKKFNDNDRWLICSEVRGELGTWLRLDPK